MAQWIVHYYYRCDDRRTEVEIPIWYTLPKLDTKASSIFFWRNMLTSIWLERYVIGIQYLWFIHVINRNPQERKTALYWAVEKNHVHVVKSLLTADPNLEIATKEGDTPLLKSVRNRSLEIVQLLLDKKARVTAADKADDTALHIAMRARSKVSDSIFLDKKK